MKRFGHAESDRSSRRAIKSTGSVAARAIVLLLAGVVLLAGAGRTMAANGADTWAGNAGVFLSTSGNWTGTNPVPISGDSWVFGTAGTSGTTLTDDLTNSSFQVAGITYNLGASAFTINPQAAATNGFTLTGNVTNSSTSLQTINDAITMTATRTFTMTSGGGNITLGGNLSGSGGGILTAGTGTLTLSGTNSYSGTTTINGTAVVNINSTTAFGNSSSVTFNSGATIDNTTGSAITLSNNNAMDSGGTLNFSTSAGTVNNSIDLGTGSFSWGGNRTITMNGAGALTLGTITKTNNAANTYTISLGTGTAATSVVTFRGVQLTATADNTARTQVFSVGTGAALVINGPITDGNVSAPGRISKTSAGTLTISGSNNTFTGGVQISAGVINLNSTTALGNGGGFSISGGTFNNTSGSAITLSGTNLVTFGGDFSYGTSAGTTANSITFGGGVTTSAGRTFTLNGAGAVTFGGAFTWTETVNGNTMLFQNGTGTASTTVVTLGGLVLGPTGTTGLVKGIGGSTSVTINGAIVDNGQNDGITFSGTGTYIVSGNNTHGGVTRLNNGTASLTLSGDNSGAAGGVTLSSGKLNLNSAKALGTGTFTIGGGTIDNTSGAAKSLTTTNAVAFNSDFTFSTSAGTTANSLTLGGGTVTMAASQTVTLNGAGALAFGGALANGTDSDRLLTVNNGTGTAATTSLSFGGYVLTPTGSIAARTGTFNGSANVNITGAVSNGVSSGSNLSYTGTGTLTLSGNNTLSGLVTVNNAAGTVTVSGDNTAMAAGITLTSGKLNLNSAKSTGTGTITLTAGTLDNTSGAAVTSSLAYTVALNGNFAFSTSSGTTNNNLNLSSGTTNINADRVITLNGAGALTLGVLTPTNNTTRTVTVNTGTGTTATSALNFNGHAITFSSRASNQQNVFNGSGSVNFVGAVTNGASTTPGVVGGLTYSGTGTMGMLSAASTYGGNTVVSSGTVAIGADSTGPSGAVTSGPIGTGILVLNGGTLIASGGARTIGNNLAPGQDIAGTIGGSQNLTFTGNFNLNNPASGFGPHYTTLTVNNNGVTSFSGGININGQQLTLQGSGNIAVDSAITGAANFFTYAGTGTLTLSGTNNYTGGVTNVNSGKVVLNGSISSSGVFVAGGTLGGTGTAGAGVTVNSGSLAPGSGTTPGTLSTTFLSFAGGHFAVDVNNATNTGSDTADQVSASSGVTLGAGVATLDLSFVGAMTGSYTQSFTLIDNTSNGATTGFFAGMDPGAGTTYAYNSGSLAYTVNYAGGTGNDVTIAFTAVPEPSTVSLIALAAAGLLIRRRRKAA